MATETASTESAPRPEMLPIFLRLGDVQHVLGVKRTTVYRLVKEDPDFPQPVKLGERAVGFLRSEIEAWAQKRADMRGRAAA